ncbi:MAG TPA: alpha/beta hydrolase, partial [Limnochordales bacterium]
GEYDYSASPASTRRLAGRIRGCRFRVLPGLGHFPMTEDPDRFREHLLLVLGELKAEIKGRQREV